MKRVTLTIMAMLLWAVAPVYAAQSKLHEQVLFTQVRVLTDKAGGSGTVIYSEKTGKFYSTYVITCHHVIESAVSIADKWDPLKQKESKRESVTPVQVQMFDYKAVPHGRPPLTGGVLADIFAYDPDHDIALLHIQLSDKPATAKLLPPGNITEVEVGSDSIAVGCALLHDPILTKGIITHLGDIMDGKDYWMSSSQIIFGNSGGAMFFPFGDEYYFIGIPSRIDVGRWSGPVTHLGYFSPIPRIYEFFKEQLLEFLIPGSKKSEAECLKLRDETRAAAKKEK